MRPTVLLYFLIVFLSVGVHGRRHKLTLKNDNRKGVLCSRFGYLKKAVFSVDIQKLEGDLRHFVFTLNKATKDGMVAYTDTKSGSCPPSDASSSFYIFFNDESKSMGINHSDELSNPISINLGTTLMNEPAEHSSMNLDLGVSIRRLLKLMYLDTAISENTTESILQTVKESPDLQALAAKLNLTFQADQTSFYRFMYTVAQHVLDHQRSQQSDKSLESMSRSVRDVLQHLLLFISPTGLLKALPYQTIGRSISTQFTVLFSNDADQGWYSFYFHNCAEVVVESGKRPPANLTIEMVERNPTSYLSAGEQPLPILYGILCAVYFILSATWCIFLRLSKNLVYRIHYLMFTVILVKALSLAFHGINYFVIGKHGVAEEGWAVMYYITHIIRGALLFTTILLIGAGWAFIKHMLTPREKHIFLFVIPLQILANIATVVIEESEAGAARYATWKEILIFVDLACCGAILFPVVWSIRHLQVASQTDGKAAMNLRKLQLFRHFYILVICYVYFTRVIVYLLNITVSYSLTWLVELFKESVTLGFFLAVGYKFRPVDDNPYLLVPNDDEEDTLMERIQLEDVWSQSGITDGVTRLSRGRSTEGIGSNDKRKKGRDNDALMYAQPDNAADEEADA